MAAASLALPSVPALAEQRPRFDGLYDQPWFLNSSSDLGKDYADTVKAGKTFVITWELRGCPWCKLLHTVNFARPDIAKYAQDNFNIVQLNLAGTKEITGFDGAKVSEEALAQVYGINSSPTLQFFKTSDAARGRELGRIGYIKPDDFFLMMRFVREKGYESGPFEDWAKANRGPA